MFFDASSVVAEDQHIAPTVITSANSWERSSSIWQLVAHLHHDAERAAQFQALARAASAKRLEWVRRVPDLHITEVVELPETERRHLAVGLQVPDGPLLTLEVAVLPDDRALDQARLWNGPPERVLKGTCCPEHAATVRSMPLNMAARFLERGVTSPLGLHPFDAWDVTEGLRPLIWFVMQRLRQQR